MKILISIFFTISMVSVYFLTVHIIGIVDTTLKKVIVSVIAIVLLFLLAYFGNYVTCR